MASRKDAGSSPSPAAAPCVQVGGSRAPDDELHRSEVERPERQPLSIGRDGDQLLGPSGPDNEQALASAVADGKVQPFDSGPVGEMEAIEEERHGGMRGEPRQHLEERARLPAPQPVRLDPLDLEPAQHPYAKLHGAGACGSHYWQGGGLRLTKPRQTSYPKAKVNAAVGRPSVHGGSVLASVGYRAGPPSGQPCPGPREWRSTAGAGSHS